MGCHAQKLLKINLRWMTGEDLPRVFELDRETSDFPCPPQDFLAILLRESGLGMVVEHAGRMIGFLVYEIQPDALWIHHLAVVPEYRRQGVASQMMARVCCQLNTGGQRLMRLNVRESNLGAQLFFQSLGFRANMIFKSHFEDTGEDAYRMHYRHKRYRVPLTARKTLIGSGENV